MRLNWTMVASTAIALLLGLSGCETVSIVADGSHTALPPARTVVAIWSNHPTVTAGATAWLLNQGLVVLDQVKIQQMVAEAPHSEPSLGKEAAVLAAAKSLGAKMIVFITQAGDMRAPIVAVRGVDVESMQILWSATARYPQYTARPFSDLLMNLTCRALAAAWGREISNDDASCVSQNSRPKT